MTNKNGYQTGMDAIRKMKSIVNDTLWLEQSYGLLFGKDLESMRKDYTLARDAAIAFGMNISDFPRKLNWETNHSLVM